MASGCLVGPSQLGQEQALEFASSESLAEVVGVLHGCALPSPLAGQRPMVQAFVQQPAQE